MCVVSVLVITFVVTKCLVMRLYSDGLVVIGDDPVGLYQWGVRRGLSRGNRWIDGRMPHWDVSGLSEAILGDGVERVSTVEIEDAWKQISGVIEAESGGGDWRLGDDEELR